MQKTCANGWCKTGFEISDEDLAIFEKISPTIAGEKIQIPSPTLCPRCRMLRRFAYRNDHNYYHNNCAVSGAPIISIYSQDKKIPVVTEDVFWSDRVDPLQYGRDYDLKRPFFEQFFALRPLVPRPAIFHTQSVNSDFTVHSSRNRNCYMCCSTIDCEDAYYTDMTFESKDSMDLTSCIRMELCYECVFSNDSFGCSYLDHCSQCTDCDICFDCRASQNLVGCAGLRQKKCMILNETSTPDECKKTRRRLSEDPVYREEFMKKFERLKLKLPRKYAFELNTEHCSGNDLFNCKNVRYGFDAKQVEDAKYVSNCVRSNDLYDICRVEGSMIYDSHAIIGSSYCSFVNLCYNSDHLLYCDNCMASQDCFGCMGLKKKQYCILNKNYSKEQYESLVPRIIEHMRRTGEWGEFFPCEMSPFGYNETKAQEIAPLTPDEARARGWPWSNYEPAQPKVDLTIPASRLPSKITEVPDEILKWVILSEQSGKPFRIIAQELALYRKRNLPVSHFEPNERHIRREKMSNPWELWKRECDKCGKVIETTYSPKRPEQVYCEECYLKEVY